MPPVDKRLRWFDEGAPMLRLVAGRLGMADKLPANEEYYACPCCLTAYNRPAVIAGVLTEEHVPPAGPRWTGLGLDRRFRGTRDLRHVRLYSRYCAY